jgi:cytochrome c biogenesis protein CcmG, thiol:disulfide interchange protein DsbE
MRRWFAPLLALSILLAGGLWYLQTAGRVTGPFLAPDFAATDLQGRTVRLSDFRGKVVLLNLWATWCEPCRQEMPGMEILYREFGAQDFTLLAVSEDASGMEAVKPYVDQYGFTFPVLLSPDGAVGRKYGITGYPETFVIDKSGQVVTKYVGPRNWADNSVRGMLRTLLQAPVAPPA